jgi:hypothetical protein
MGAALGFCSKATGLFLSSMFWASSPGGKGLFETLSNPQTNGSLGFPISARHTASAEP